MSLQRRLFSVTQLHQLVSKTDPHQSSLIDTSNLQESDCSSEGPHIGMQSGCDSYAN